MLIIQAPYDLHREHITCKGLISFTIQVQLELLGVGTDIVTQLVEEGHHLLKVGVVALCQVLCAMNYETN